jgi:hypothetical protein
MVHEICSREKHPLHPRFGGLHAAVDQYAGTHHRLAKRQSVSGIGMAERDPSWSYALGGQADVGGKFAVAKQIDLSQSPFNFGNQHKDHSGQFNSDNMNRSQVWNQALNQMRLK